MAGMVIDEAHPAMFRARPFWFISCIILILVFRLGVLPLLHWYIHTRQTALTVTRLRAALREGHPEQGSHLSLAQARPRRARDARVPEPYSRRWDLSKSRPRAIRRSSRWRTCRTLERSEKRSRKRRTKARIRTGMPSAHDDRDQKGGDTAPARRGGRAHPAGRNRMGRTLHFSRQARSQECGADFFRRLSRRDPGHGRRVGRSQGF